MRACPTLPLGHVLALVADALALVGLRRALLADDRGGLPHQLLGDALHDDPRGLGHFELDPARRRDRYRVGVADGELEVLALQLRAVAHALDLQALFVARGDALHHVGHQRAGEPVQRAMLAAVGGAGDEQLLAFLDDLDVAVHALLQLAFGPAHAHRLRLDRDGHAARHGDWLSSDPGHRECVVSRSLSLSPALFRYQTCARTSPPTPAARASWPVITPCEVETIDVPIPPSTFGIPPACT